MVGKAGRTSIVVQSNQMGSQTAYSLILRILRESAVFLALVDFGYLQQATTSGDANKTGQHVLPDCGSIR